MVTTDETILAVEAVLALPFLLLGLSHCIQKQMWVDFFSELAARGPSGVVWRTFMLELWPAVLIVVFHQDWRWPGLIITLYGHLLMVKVGLSVLAPELGLKSLRQVERVGLQGFLVAGGILIVLGLLCGYRALGL
ncbi:MAG: hypothetical protein AAGJ32_02870 [Pseudomonadota bacterium]